ncbi:MAG: hypothetical protein ACJ76Q_11720, partial [Solirubrobacteraceae bacterium]
MLQPVADRRDAVGFAAIARQTARAQESAGSRAHTALTDRLSEAVARRRAGSAVGDDEPGSTRTPSRSRSRRPVPRADLGRVLGRGAAWGLG